MGDHLVVTAVFLGSLVQAVLFTGWPVPWKKIGRSVLVGLLLLIPWPMEQHYEFLSHLIAAAVIFDMIFAIQFNRVVLAFVNEQSLWIMTILYWFFIWKYALITLDNPAMWLLIVMSVVMTGFVVVAAFTRFVLPHWANVLFYLWYLCLDLYISLVFLIKSPSNIFVHLTTANVFDYFYFGLVTTHLICILWYALTAFPWPKRTRSYSAILREWHCHVSALGSRYLDRQVSSWYPTSALLMVIALLLVTPFIPLLNDFAMVGTILAVGTWITGQRMGTT